MSQRVFDRPTGAAVGGMVGFTFFILACFYVLFTNASLDHEQYTYRLAEVLHTKPFVFVIVVSAKKFLWTIFMLVPIGALIGYVLDKTILIEK